MIKVSKNHLNSGPKKVEIVSKNNNIIVLLTIKPTYFELVSCKPPRYHIRFYVSALFLKCSYTYTWVVVIYTYAPLIH